MRNLIAPALAAIALAGGLLPNAFALAQDGPPPPGRGGPGAAMMRADSDGDGAVTRAEALAEAGRRFDRLDLNRDGRLTADELRAVPHPGRRGMDGGPPPPPVD